VAILESQLSQAKMIAKENDRKYKKVAHKLTLIEADLERAEERAKTGGSKLVKLEEDGIPDTERAKNSEVIPDLEELKPIDDITTGGSLTHEDKADHEDQDDHEDKVFDWLRKKVKDLKEHE